MPSLANALALRPRMALDLQISPAQFEVFVTDTVLTWFRRGFIKPYAAFDFGVGASLRLLELAVLWQHEYPARKSARQFTILTALLLDMLDRLDEWDEFLHVWQYFHDTHGYNGSLHARARVQRKVAKRAAGKAGRNLLHKRVCTTPPDVLRTRFRQFLQALPDLLNQHVHVPF